MSGTRPSRSATCSELLPVFEEAGIDAAFWFTFAGYGHPHRDEPRADLDLASYGVVKMLPGGAGHRPGRAWAGSRSWPSRRWPAPTHPAEAGTGGAPVT